MEILKRIAELEDKMKQLVGTSVEPLKEKEEAHEEEPVEDFDAKLSTEHLERFYDGLLTTLGELELEGQLPTLDSPAKVRDALLAVVRQL